MFPLVFLTHAVFPETFTEVHVNGAISLWYITVIFPILGTGLVITIESWATAWREKSLLQLGRAGWNTFAQIHNTMGAIRNFGPALEMVGKAFGSALDSKGNSKDKGSVLALMLMILIVVVAISAGALLTATIINRYAGTVPLPREMARA
jgi:hypothetical protein